jgi:hypothetical protein
MKITYKKDVNDPPYPIMVGNTPSAKEFNKRSEALWKAGILETVNNDVIVTILIEMLIEDYNKRHASRKKTK